MRTGLFNNLRAATRGSWLVAACAVAFVGGCIDEAVDRAPPDSLRSHVLEQQPEGLEPIDANFSGKVTLVGARVLPEGPYKPGASVKLEMVWRVDEELESADWKLFTHVLGRTGRRLMNVDNVGPLRRARAGSQAYAPGRWEKGKYYLDTQSFRLPRKRVAKELRVVVGIWKGQERLTLLSGPNAGQNRALVARLPLEPPPPPAEPVPQMAVNRLKRGERIVIDGRLNERAWRGAADTGAFVDVGTGKPAAGKLQASAKLAWDARYLYVAASVRDQDVVGGFDPKQTDPHLWTKDCLEIMVDPDGDGDNKDYYEIQINPQNLVFDSRFDDYNRPAKQPDGPFGHQDWRARVDSAVRVRGTLDNAKDRDTGYVVEARIPWSSFDRAGALPPRPGTSWRINLYAMENNTGVSWSPILRQGNFHKASRFGKVTWATGGASGAVTTAAAEESSVGRRKAAARRRAKGAPRSGAPRSGVQ